MTPSARVTIRRGAWPLWAGPRPLVALSTRPDRLPATGVCTVRLAPAYTGGEIQGVRPKIVSGLRYRVSGLLWEGNGKLSAYGSTVCVDLQCLSCCKVPTRKARVSHIFEKTFLGTAKLSSWGRRKFPVEYFLPFPLADVDYWRIVCYIIGVTKPRLASHMRLYDI